MIKPLLMAAVLAAALMTNATAAERWDRAPSGPNQASVKGSWGDGGFFGALREWVERLSISRLIDGYYGVRMHDQGTLDRLRDSVRGRNDGRGRGDDSDRGH